MDRMDMPAPKNPDLSWIAKWDHEQFLRIVRERIHKYEGNLTNIAIALGIDRVTLHRYLWAWPELRKDVEEAKKERRRLARIHR